MSEIERKEFIRKQLLLPEDVLLFPVREMAEHLRQKLECAEGDFAVTRPHMRSFSRIVDRDTAMLLEEFRRPTSLVDAILRHSQAKGLDPHALLENAFPVLQAFSAAAFLVPADSPLAKGVVASFAPGQIVAGYEVRRLIQVLEDSEVYQARAKNGHVAALKLTCKTPHDRQSLAFLREATALKQLMGVCSPNLLEYGTYRVFIATTWKPGVPVSRRAQELRKEQDKGWRDWLHRLCCHILCAYCALHDRGVIHGDVHPSNVFADSNDDVFILDYGLSRLTHISELDHNHRPGLAWFMEPELAAALLDGRILPVSSYAGEQYSVAALIYYLLSGEYYLTDAPERKLLYRRVLEAAPAPFACHGSPRWPGIEKVLARALAKAPSDRYQSMSEFRDEFVRAYRIQVNVNQKASPALSEHGWVNSVIGRACALRSYEQLFPESPTASVYFGAAGFVWFLYRVASLRNDPQLLAMADLWFRRTSGRIEASGSFGSPGSKTTDERNGQASLYLGQSGVHLLGALVGLASGDFHLGSHHVRSFLDICQLDEPSSELLFGRSGLLVGGSMLVAALGWFQRFDTEDLARMLQKQAKGLWKALYRQPGIASQDRLPHLGLAHGWSGILYAQLLLHKVLGLAPATDIYDALEDLAGRAEPHGRGVAWLGTLRHPDQVSETPTYAPGWCSGSGGYVYLWILAAEVVDDTRFLDLAEKAAWHTWEHADRTPNLCCGLTGRAFALLRYYRQTGEDVWLARAKQLAGLALDLYRDTDSADSRFYSLFRGPLGTALLAIELDFPERSVFPMFELEGWPIL